LCGAQSTGCDIFFYNDMVCELFFFYKNKKKTFRWVENKKKLEKKRIYIVYICYMSLNMKYEAQKRRIKNRIKKITALKFVHFYF